MTACDSGCGNAAPNPVWVYQNTQLQVKNIQGTRMSDEPRLTAARAAITVVAGAEGLGTRLAPSWQPDVTLWS